jgi:septal ring factor EnvC (AmiA/AmiB activator)
VEAHHTATVSVRLPSDGLWCPSHARACVAARVLLLLQKRAAKLTQQLSEATDQVRQLQTQFQRVDQEMQQLRSEIPALKKTSAASDEGRRELAEQLQAAIADVGAEQRRAAEIEQKLLNGQSRRSARVNGVRLVCCAAPCDPNSRA